MVASRCLSKTVMSEQEVLRQCNMVGCCNSLFLRIRHGVVVELAPKQQKEKNDVCEQTEEA